MGNCLLWFRKDLRLFDNPSLSKAVQYEKTFPIFIFDESLYEYNKIGSASLWWLENSLTKLKERLDNKLSILKGDSLDLITKLSSELEIESVFWNRCYEPDRIEKDKKIKKILINNNINVETSNASLLWEPWKIKNKSGNFYKVFTPFYKRGCLEAAPPRLALDKPKNLSLDISEKSNFPSYRFRYFNKINHWSIKFKKYWNPGEEEAQNRLNYFLKEGAKDYSEGRNYPSKKIVSRLSPHLHWGEISPFQVWNECKNKMSGNNKDIFLSELAWREFSYYLLFHFPKINCENLKSNFNYFQWDNNVQNIELWQKGKTGYPIVDAGMRELWETGYMHNRLRMVTSSFLVKNLLSHWKYGEKWFWDCLVDADLASNSASWQWVAGTGTDAAPFFRIFNPISQAEKFDKNADYIRRFVPELAKLPNKFIFSPWTASDAILSDSGIKLGKDYPKPLIDYKLSRNRALETFKNLRKNNI